MELHTGEIVAIYGPRNAGKSTLLRIAAGLTTPDEGVVRLDGKELAKLDKSEWNRWRLKQLGWVAKVGPRSRHWDMVDWVALSLLDSSMWKDARRQAMAALKTFGVAECATAGWNELAGTEQMLVALAHAIVREPELVLMDDPTAGLDALERDRIMSLLRTLAEETGFGMLLASPDVPSRLRPHSVLSLSDGRLGKPVPGAAAERAGQRDRVPRAQATGLNSASPRARSPRRRRRCRGRRGRRR